MSCTPGSLQKSRAPLAGPMFAVETNNELLDASEAMIIERYGQPAPDYQDEAANAFARRERLSGGKAWGETIGERKRT